jgi:hypothetical protein
MPRPHFSLRDLFLATTLIAAGVGAFVYFRGQLTHLAFFHPFWYPLIYMAASASIGTGLLTPFHRKVAGLILGAIIGYILCGLFWPRGVWVP